MPKSLTIRYRRTFQHGQYQNQDVDLTYTFDLPPVCPEPQAIAEAKKVYQQLEQVGEQCMLDALNRPPRHK